MSARSDAQADNLLHDPLTGLLSRAAVLEALNRALSLADRLQHPVTVLFLTLDDAQRWQKLPPAEANTLEQALATRLGARIRIHDVLGRWATGQYLAVLPDADVPSALVLAQDLQSLLPLPGRGDLTISIGVHGRMPSARASLYGLAGEMVVAAQRAVETTLNEGPGRLVVEPAPADMA